MAPSDQTSERSLARSLIASSRPPNAQDEQLTPTPGTTVLASQGPKATQRPATQKPCPPFGVQLRDPFGKDSAAPSNDRTEGADNGADKARREHSPAGRTTAHSNAVAMRMPIREPGMFFSHSSLIMGKTNMVSITITTSINMNLHSPTGGTPSTKRAGDEQLRRRGHVPTPCSSAPQTQSKTVAWRNLLRLSRTGQC